MATSNKDKLGNLAATIAALVVVPVSAPLLAFFDLARECRRLPLLIVDGFVG